MKTNLYYLLAICVCFALFLPSCNKIQSITNKPNGQLVNSTDCKTITKSGNTVLSSSNDCIEYNYTDNEVLYLKHTNAGFNCCPGKIKTDVDVKNMTITIVEKQTKAECDCQCLYDLDYEINDLPPGQYTIKINEQLINDNSEQLEFTVNLDIETTGSYCVTRNNYPWGI